MTSVPTSATLYVCSTQAGFSRGGLGGDRVSCSPASGPHRKKDFLAESCELARAKQTLLLGRAVS